ncbi:hypothetical protein LJK88_14785 [Paenibacillus sp. P26]|nr:hypothetical protein LJK88_14785 [Paenibacillus sp. P26]UUZ96854.1 hypothetical protein LJK87_22975 [Paenibacillus sp. P25]
MLSLLAGPDEEILKTFSFRLEGTELTQEEALRLIQLIRSWVEGKEPLGW